MMRLIDADKLLEKMEHRRDYVGRLSDPVCLIEDAPTVAVQCKDCIHYGHMDGKEIVFPDYVCPCQCDDYWYSWLPPPDWFCAKSEAGPTDCEWEVE
jgi:hypothetical protein